MVCRHTRRSFFFLFCHSRAISIAPNFSAHSYQHRRRQPTVENGWAALPFPKWIKYLFFFHRNILFRLDKTFRIHIFIRFWEFRWLNFSSHSVMCDIFIFFFFSCASCLSLCVCACSFCYLLCAIATTLCHFQNWNSYYLLSFFFFAFFLSFFSSSSSHSRSALSASVFHEWRICVHGYHWAQQHHYHHHHHRWDKIAFVLFV